MSQMQEFICRSVRIAAQRPNVLVNRVFTPSHHPSYAVNATATHEFRWNPINADVSLRVFHHFEF